MQDDISREISSLTSKLMGEAGAFVIAAANTALVKINCRAIYFPIQTVVTTLTASNWSGETAAATYPAGTTLLGKFTSIQKSTDSAPVICYL